MIVIRKVVNEDLKTIVKFNMNLAKETEGYILSDEKITAGVQALLEDPLKGQYYIAEMDGEVVGQTSVTLEWSDWRNGYWWWIQSVYIVPSARKSGVFRALYKHILQYAQKSDAVGLRLYVDRSNQTAQKTYLNLGMDESHYLFFEKELSDHAG